MEALFLRFFENPCLVHGAGVFYTNKTQIILNIIADINIINHL